MIAFNNLSVDDMVKIPTYWVEIHNRPANFWLKRYLSSDIIDKIAILSRIGCKLPNNSNLNAVRNVLLDHIVAKGYKFETTVVNFVSRLEKCNVKLADENEAVKRKSYSSKCGGPHSVYNHPQPTIKAEIQRNMDLFMKQDWVSTDRHLESHFNSLCDRYEIL